MCIRDRSDTAIISAPTITINTTDTLLMEQIKADLIGKEVLSWNAIKSKEIKELTISSVSELDNNSNYTCLLYTSDAADERSSVDLGGRRIIKKKKQKKKNKRKKKYTTQER